MRPIVDGIYEWSWFSSEKQIDFNGHLVSTGTGREWVMIDPPPLTADDHAEVERLGRITAIIVTNRDHEREAARDREIFRVPVFAHVADAPLMELKADRTFAAGDRLPGDLIAVHVPNAKSPGESALWWSSGRALIVGDAVIGKPPGALRMLPDEKFADAKKAKEGLRVLLDARYDYDAVLVGDGASIPAGGREALVRFLST
jgi:glyoxylase-like metal-dependent hydrolase (beta-lactamase superfamily II)